MDPILATKVRSACRLWKRLACVAALAIAISACVGMDSFLPGPRRVNDIIEFQPLVTPGAVEAEPVLALARAAAVGIDREFGVDLSRSPDDLEYGIASCTEGPSCLGRDAGAGPWTVWHLRWQPDARASWVAMLFDTATEEFIWIGAGER